jgi:hypothetical protein
MQRSYIPNIILVFGLLAIWHATAIAEPVEVTLGILEHQKGDYSGDKNYHTVRVVFKSAAGEWQPFESNCEYSACLQTITSKFPSKVKWTIAFDGKNLGQLSTVNPIKFKFYSHVGQQQISGNQKIPSIGKPSYDFNGWENEEVYRPLVAISQPNYKDPEQWKPSRSSNKYEQLVRDEFRKKFPKVENCDEKDAVSSKPWPYSDSDIKILKSYSSNKNWTLAQLSLEGNHCDMLDDNSPFLGQWFTVSPERTISHLGEGMILVDAGDYDNDGRSEIVFKTSGYNRGGYKIFYKAFSKHALFEFGFH